MWLDTVHASWGPSSSIEREMTNSHGRSCTDMMFREKTMLGGVFFSKTGSGFFEMAWGGMLPQLSPSQIGAQLAAQIVSKTVQDGPRHEQYQREKRPEEGTYHGVAGMVGPFYFYVSDTALPSRV